MEKWIVETEVVIVDCRGGEVKAVKRFRDPAFSLEQALVRSWSSLRRVRRRSGAD